MPGLDHAFATHHLVIKPERCLLKQAPRSMPSNLATKVQAEVDRLETIGFIREVQYPNWLANIVPVKKKTDISESVSTSETKTRLVLKMTSPSLIWSCF